MKFTKVLLPTLLTGLLAACGGSGGDSSTTGSGGDSSTGTEPITTAVTLSAQVYDQEVANAEVTIYVGETAVATTTTDADGNYSVTLQVTEEARNNACVAIATRDNISLRSLLGNVGAITDTATANGGNITPAILPSANVTNVSTAVAAIIEQSGGVLPDTQAEIDAAIAAIANDPTLQQNVVLIAAAIKAVVDYGGDTTVIGSATNTDELAKALAASPDLAADLDTVVASSNAASADQLVLEVEGDPKLAEQIPSEEAALIAGLAGNYYVTNNQLGEETLLYFHADGTTVTVADYSDIESGGITGTYTDNQDGTFTINFTDPIDGALEVILTITGGSANAISTQISVTDNAGTAVEGPHILRRMIPVAATGSTTQIGIADLAGKIIVDIDYSTAVNIGTCNGATNTTLHSAQGALSGATCSVALGMLVIEHVGYGKTVHGLLADSWDGTNISQKISVVNWEADATLGSVATYSRVYQPINAGVPAANSKRLRIYPNDSNGGVTSQLQFVTALDTAGDTTAGGKIDLYQFNGTAKSKDHIIQTTATLTGSLLVNGSVNEALPFDSHASTSVGINLGNDANSRLSAVFAPHKTDGTAGSIRTRYSYDLRNVTAADVSGKTFVYTDLVYADTGTVVFNADGTGLSDEGVGGVDNFTWSIAPAVPASSGVTSGVNDYGTTLKLTYVDGTADYLFVKELGGSFIVGGYYLLADGTYNENLAIVLTPQ